MPVASYDQYGFLKEVKGGDALIASLYRRTVNMLRRSFLQRAGPGKYEMNILIEDIAFTTARIFDLERKVMKKLEAEGTVEEDKENLLLKMKSERIKCIEKLHILSTGKDIFKALSGKQGYRNAMVRSKVMKQELEIQKLNEDPDTGNNEDETPVGSGTGGDV